MKNIVYFKEYCASRDKMPQETLRKIDSHGYAIYEFLKSEAGKNLLCKLRGEASV